MVGLNTPTKTTDKKIWGQTQESHDLPDAHISEARRKLGLRIRWPWSYARYNYVIYF